MPIWVCSMKPKLKAPGEMYVGDIFSLVCNGEPVVGLKNPKIYFLEEKLNHTLKIINPVMLDPKEVTLDVVSYKPGKHNLPFYVVDGESAFKTEGLTWEVQAYLGKKDSPKAPYGAFSPLKIALPWWYWAMWITPIVLAIVLVVLKLRKMNERKNLVDELLTHGIVLTPYQQFNKEYRKTSKDNERKKIDNKEYLELIEEHFKSYIGREFLVPAHKWADKEVLSDIKRRHKRVFEDCGQNIKRMLFEFTKIKKESIDVRPEDCNQLAEMSQNIVGLVNKSITRRTKR